MTETQKEYIKNNSDKKVSQLARETGLSYWEVRKFFKGVKKISYRMDEMLFGFRIPEIRGFDSRQ